jgi:hypothetical protein
MKNQHPIIAAIFLGLCGALANVSTAQEGGIADAEVVVAHARVGGGETRGLKADEERALRRSLRWNPQRVSISPGRFVQSTLIDGSGTTLAIIKVSWDRVRGDNLADFTVMLENRSTCNFNSSAEIRNSRGFGTLVSTINWFGWVNLRQPAPGTYESASGTVPYPVNLREGLELVPELSDSTLTMCRTSDTPVAAAPPARVAATRAPAVATSAAAATVEDSNCSAYRSFARSSAESSRSMIPTLSAMGPQFGEMQRLNADMWDAISRASCPDLAAAESTLTSLTAVDPSPAGVARAEASIRALPPSIRDHVLRQFQAMRSAMNQ